MCPDSVVWPKLVAAAPAVELVSMPSFAVVFREPRPRLPRLRLLLPHLRQSHQSPLRQLPRPPRPSHLRPSEFAQVERVGLKRQEPQDQSLTAAWPRRSIHPRPSFAGLCPDPSVDTQTTPQPAL